MKLPEELQFIENARLPQKQTNARLDGRVCVLTGATSGVGYQAAKCLHRAGARLALVCRNRAKAEHLKTELENAGPGQVDIFIADFASLAQVRRVAAELLEGYPAIHLLINNAGVHYTHRELTEDGNETVFGVNHLASFLLTRLLLERLKTSAPARVLQVNSEGHRFGGLRLDDLTWKKRPYIGLRAYGASKTAQLLTVWELADQLAGSGVSINAVHPGDVKSNIGMNNGLIYRLYKRIFVTPMLKDPAVSGEAIYYLAAAPEMEGVSGRFYYLTNEEVPAPHARDRALGRAVWQVSEQLCGLAPGQD